MELVNLYQFTGLKPSGSILERGSCVPGSPRLVIKPLWRSWQRVGLIIPRSWVRPPPEACFYVFGALVAQLAALRSYEPMVRGSSPRRSNFVAELPSYPASPVRYHGTITFH